MASNYETIFEAIKAALSALADIAKLVFANKKTTAENKAENEKHSQIIKEPEKLHPSQGIIDPVEFAYHFGHLPYEEQLEIQRIIEKNKAEGITDYKFKTTHSKVFRVVNGGQILESTEGIKKDDLVF